MRWAWRFVLGFCLCVAGVWGVNSTYWVEVPPEQRPKLIAHRGVHQISASETRDGATCGANPIVPPSHDYITNTLRSIGAAFAFGADVVEIDVHLTADGVFALFHDWTLDCQTDGAGVTHEQTFAKLRQLDLGYGFSVDGKTFPLRGTGIGLMPRLTEVLDADLHGQVLINFKSKRRQEGVDLQRLLNNADRRARVFGVYGGGPPTRAALAGLPGLRGFDRAALRNCLLRYMALGWSGHMPQSCRDRIIAVPMDYAPLLWGWPHRFTNRMKAAGTAVILWGPYDGSGFSSGIDDAETLRRVPEQFDGYLWTNRIERIGPMLDRAALMPTNGLDFAAYPD